MATTRRIRLLLPYPAPRGDASVYDLIEDENCLHEADHSKISSIRKSALGSFRDLAGDRGPHEPQSCLTRQPKRYQKGSSANGDVTGTGKISDPIADTAKEH